MDTCGQVWEFFSRDALIYISSDAKIPFHVDGTRALINSVIVKRDRSHRRENGSPRNVRPGTCHFYPGLVTGAQRPGPVIKAGKQNYPEIQERAP